MKVSLASHSLHRGGGSGHTATDELLPRQHVTISLCSLASHTLCRKEGSGHAATVHLLPPFLSAKGVSS